MFGDDQAGQVRWKRIREQIADAGTRSRAVQPGFVKLLTKLGNLVGVRINGDHIQVGLTNEFLDQPPRIETKHQRVTLRRPRGFEYLGRFVRPCVCLRCIRRRFCMHDDVRRLLGAERADSPFASDDKQPTVSG